MDMTNFIQKLLAKLGITVGPEVTPEDALILIEPLAKKLAAEAVDDAIAAGMLFPRERESLITVAEQSLAAFRMFLTKRGPISPALLALAKRAPSVGARMSQTDIEVAQRLGVSRETLLKYNSPEATHGMTPIELQIAAQVGVKPELYRKHNPPASK